MLVAMPLIEPIMATAGLLLVHVPPVVASCNVETAPWQMLVIPVMPAGVAFTVIALVTAPQEPPTA